MKKNRDTINNEKIAIYTLCVLLLFSFAGCGKTSEKKSNSSIETIEEAQSDEISMEGNEIEPSIADEE